MSDKLLWKSGEWIIVIHGIAEAENAEGAVPGSVSSISLALKPFEVSKNKMGCDPLGRVD